LRAGRVSEERADYSAIGTLDDITSSPRVTPEVYFALLFAIVQTEFAPRPAAGALTAENA